MKTSVPLSCSLLVPMLMTVTVAQGIEGSGEDWPQWRGADRTGVSTETGWNAEGLQQPLWTKEIGFGHSSFAVADGRLFAMGHDEQGGKDVVFCLDPVTGAERWTHEFPAEIWNEGHDGGTCTTPTVDGDTVYASNREGKLFALRADTGSVKWSRDMRADLDVTPPRWGFSGSPVIVDDLVVTNIDKLAAFEKSSGELAWISENQYGNAYSTPIEYEFNGRPTMLVLNGLGLAVIDRTDGSEVTFYSWTRNPERSVYGAMPVIVDDRIFISSGTGCVMLEPNEDDELDVVWESRAMRTSYAGAMLYEGHLYGFDASILKCIDLDGNEKWRERGIGLGAVSLVGGRLVIIGAKGELIIAEANPDQYVELSRHKVLDGGAYWSTPVLSHGLVYARNSLGDMICRDYRSSDAGAPAASRAAPETLPPAESLLQAHVAAIGGADALRGLSSVHLRGIGESHGGGPIERCDAELTWVAPDAFVWRFESGLDFGYRPGLGWSMAGMGPELLDDERIARLREVGDLHRQLGSTWGFTALKTVGTRVIDDRLCYVVDAQASDGGSRTLYFEVESGLLAGQESDDRPLWIFDDYRPVGGAKVPMEWSFFEPNAGSMTLARFTEATANVVEDAWLEPPTLVAMMTRSDEEKAAADERLRAAHGDLVGSYKLATGSMAGTPLTISIDEGGIRLAFGPNPPDYLSEPDDEDRLYVMSNRQLYMTAKRDAPGDDYEIVFYAYGDEFGRLERVDD